MSLGADITKESLETKEAFMALFWDSDRIASFSVDLIHIKGTESYAVFVMPTRFESQTEKIEVHSNDNAQLCYLSGQDAGDWFDMIQYRFRQWNIPHRCTFSISGKRCYAENSVEKQSSYQEFRFLDIE
jgi:hypothetical protein